MNARPISGIDEEQRRVALGRLLVFGDAFGLDAASTIWESVGEKADTLILALQALRQTGDAELAAALSGSPPVYRLTASGRSAGKTLQIASDEKEAVQGAHAEYFVSLIEWVAENHDSVDSKQVVLLIDRAHADLGPALIWMIEHNESERALGAVWSLIPFWKAHSLLAGRVLAESLLATPSLHGPGHSRTVVLDLLGHLAYSADDFSSSRSWYEQGLAASRVSEPASYVAHFLHELAGVCVLTEDFSGAHQYCEELLGRFDEDLDPRERVSALNLFATTVLEDSNLGITRELLETALIIASTLDDLNPSAVAGLLNTLGHVAFDQGNLDEAYRLYSDSLERWRQLGDPQGIAYLLGSLGNTATVMGSYAEARTAFVECLQIQARRRDQGSVCVLMRCFACLAGAKNQHERVLILEGAAQAIYQPIDDYELTAKMQKLLDRSIDAAGEALGAPRAQSALAKGQGMRQKASITYALSD